ncbi:MAG: group 1 truncated hemoglobin [Pseudomonadota bacterium]
MFRFRRRSEFKPRMRVGVIMALISALLLASGCASTHAPAPQKSVYEQLGGELAVRRFIEDFTWMMAHDERVAEIVAFTDWEHFRPVMHDYICHVSGGGCDYHGQSMADAHRGIGITHGEFNVSVELMQKAMTQNDIPLSAQNRLLAVLAPQRPDIVHR